MSVIVHFVARDDYDKFPASYINFMKFRMPEHEHHFFLKPHDGTKTINAPLKLLNNDNVYYYDNILKLIFRPSNLKLLRRCDKIIITGWITLPERIFFLLSGLMPKTYLHFWNGNSKRYEGFSMLVHPRYCIMLLMIKRAAATINLIEGDRENLVKAFPSNTKHFVAPMSGIPLKKEYFAAFRAQQTQTSVHRIIVAHSAYSTSLHMEAFRTLEHLKDENVEIICPLSYGDADYREQVIKEGHKVFGEKFTPLTSFMDREEYIRLLSSCDVGVFMTHTQQGMGNISLLLRLGKKVYLRENTAMWEYFVDTKKYILYPVSELEGITLEQLVNFPSEQAYNNVHLADEYAAGDEPVRQWRKVFAD